MSQKLNDPNEQRRPLSFPVVKPCITVSSSVLLASLVTTAQNICSFHPNSFVLQRRNLREMARQIAILLIFFQEIHERGSVIALPVRLCFSDLHVTLQKINFLVQDCSLEGARFWVLTNSEFIVTHIRVLIRALAAALDLVSLSFVDISDEVKELVELVATQAKRVKVELDENDEREMRRLRLILDQLERGIEPDVEIGKLVLNYLGVKSWSACNKEIKFLEDELDFNDKEVSLLSSLIGFLCYCRVAIFETMEVQSIATEEQFELTKRNTETLSCVVPQDFLCPISLEIMTDPVTVSTGQTYNRASIQKWLKSGNMICPKTREKLTSTELFPNAALKKLIKQFCSDYGIVNRINPNQTMVKITEAGSSGAAHAMQFCSWFLSRRLVFGTEEQKSKAAYEIRLLARSNVFNRACLVEMGTVPPLLDLLITTNDRTAQENAIRAVMKLSKHSSGRQVIIESRGLVPILNVLKTGLSLQARHVAAAVIFNLSSQKEYRKVIGENPDAIPALVELVREGTAKNNAVVAIFGLLLRAQNHAKVLDAGAVPALVNVLASNSDKPDLLVDSLAVLVALVESADGAYALFKAEALPLLIGILQSSTSRAGKEYCVSILLALCVNVGAQVTAVLAKDPSLMPFFYSLLTHGTPHAANKARSLINLLLHF